MRADLSDMDKRKITGFNDQYNGLSYRVGREGITEIKYHTPKGEGDRHFIDVYYQDGTAIRWILDNILILFEKEVE